MSTHRWKTVRNNFTRPRLYSGLSIAVAAMLFTFPAWAGVDVPLQNWQVPGLGKSAGKTLDGTPTDPLAFIALTPCRLVDTRGNGAPFQGGAYSAGETRRYDFRGVCGIPASFISGRLALSLHVTAVPGGSYGHVIVYPDDAAVPGTSNVNFSPNQATGSAVLVGGSGGNTGTFSVENSVGVAIIGKNTVGTCFGGCEGIIGSTTATPGIGSIQPAGILG